MVYDDIDKLKTPGARLKHIRNELLKLSRSEMFKKYGLSPDTLAAWENEKLPVSESAIERCIKIYNAESLLVSREWLLTGKGLNPNFSFNFNRYFKSQKMSESAEKLDDNFLLAKEIEFFRSLSSGSVTAFISNDDMLPFYSRGDHVGGRLKYGHDIEGCIGKDCIINLKDGSMYIRRVSKSPTGDGYNLNCLNSAWAGNPDPIIFNVEIDSAAPIIWHRRLEDDQQF
jgi:transcriptional regulator with XRE-family HTH domain